MTGRVLFYVQHLLGVGHVKRAEILAQAMHAAGLDVTVAFGGRPLAEAPFAGIRLAQLPPAAIAGEDFSALIDENGVPVDDAWKSRRMSALLQLLEARPDVVLIELFPFGRRQFRFELLPLLEAIRSADRRPRVAASVRDILVAPKRPGREAEAAALAKRYFDTILVHGDPRIIPFARTFERFEEIAGLVRHTGYVAASAAEPQSPTEVGEVIVAAGGGGVGGRLLDTALAARAMTPLAGHTWRLIAGPNLSNAEFSALVERARTEPGFIVERFRDDYAARLAGAALSISQAGYNTCMDLLRARPRALLVPYEKTGETEQRLRAELLAEKGVLTVLPEAALSPTTLAAAVGNVLRGPPPNRLEVDLNGAATTARLIAELAGHPS
jgi:predicted glycosyltransferase